MLLLCNIIVTETIGALLGELTIGEMDKTLCVVNFLSYIFEVDLIVMKCTRKPRRFSKGH